MQLQPLFRLSYLQPSNIFNSDNYADIKPWVMRAIAEEDQRPNNQLWKGEPSAAFQYDERLRRIKFFRKCQRCYPLAKYVADRLELCERNNRCCSGACPECGRLLQRWFVRRSKGLICDAVDIDGRSLVAITIIPAKPIIRPGKLPALNIGNLQRCLKYALDKAEIGAAIGAVAFSYNEDKDGKYSPFWSGHFYIITSVAGKARLKKILRRLFASDRRIPRPVRVSTFNNSARRRSYAFKTQFNRRVGIDADNYNKADGSSRKCRNTSRQRLRAAERLELYIYLDRIGLAERFIFRKVKPTIKSTKVKLKAIEA